MLTRCRNCQANIETLKTPRPGPAREFCGVPCRNRWHNDRRKPRGAPRVVMYAANVLRLREIPAREMEILIGTLLGDGSISLTKQGKGMLNLTHASKHESYFRWKVENLASLFLPNHRVGRITSLKRGTVTHAISAYSIARDDLGLMRARFYPQGTKIVPPGLDLTPLSIAVWHMDDGSMETRGKSHRFTLATNCFDAQSLERLERALRRHGVIVAVNRGSQGHVLRISGRSNVETFAALVRPHVHPVMLYKLP